MKFFLMCFASMALVTLGEIHKPFNLNLFTHVIDENPSKNVIISPVSVASGLGLIYLGAESATADEMQNALFLLTKEETAQSYGEFLKKFQQYDNAEVTKFEIANRVYVDEKYEINPKYAELASEYFHSTAEPVDFADGETTAEKINAWVSNHTNNKINDIINAGIIGPSTSAVLVNAIYFNGHWQNHFEVENTAKKDFFLSKSEKKSVDMMYQQNYFEYADLNELDARAIRIPYANTDLHLLIALPNKVDGLKDVFEKFKTVNLQIFQDDFAVKKVNLHLPKLKFEFGISLNHILSKMGLKSMFSGDANFGSLLKDQRSLPISEVAHKAFIEVDEFGTEASASTAIFQTRSASGHSDDPNVYDFNVDRPFMFAIKSPEIVYFAGQVTEV